jgi:hypothetical protein
MSLVYYANTFITGLSTDTKPTVGDGYQFLETDTGNNWQRTSATWVATPTNAIIVNSEDLKPTTPIEGTLCYVRLTKLLYQYINGIWIQITPDLDEIMERLEILENQVKWLGMELDINIEDIEDL